MKKEEIIKSIEKIEKISEELVQTKEEIKDEQLERYFCKLEKTRMDMYHAARQRNLWLKFMDKKEPEFIDNEYKAEVENEILKIYIPEKIPTIKNGANYTQKRIMQNVSRVVRKYEELFYDKFTMVLIKIYDDGKIWDADNRNVKPIHDGLIYGKIIRDDNIYCTCYMVQGYYSDKPHAEVYVLPADEITRVINQKMR
ncbi:MAG: hypothetical protein HFJ29_09680 [Clostridia bacterium]|nr:hypothetical protein [Clostridia bacterium]